MKKAFAAFVAVILTAGFAAAVLAGHEGNPNCDVEASAPADDGCCTGSGSSAADGSCSVACPLLLTAIASPLVKTLAEAPGVAPIASPEFTLQAISGPPDTAPPKSRLS